MCAAIGACRGACGRWSSKWRHLPQKERLLRALPAGATPALSRRLPRLSRSGGVRWSPFASTAHRSRPPSPPPAAPSAETAHISEHAGSAASADAARAAAQEAGKALSANSAQTSKAIADAAAKYSASSQAGLADASKLIGKNTGEAIKASSKAIDSVTASVKPRAYADKTAAGISKGADQFVASASDFGGQIQASTGELSEALKEFTSNSASFPRWS